MNLDNLLFKGEQIREWIIKIRRDIHETPELAMQEYVTQDKIKKYLYEIGIDYKEYDDHRGVMAYIVNDENLETIGIRADIDALPILEENNKSYKSIYPGIMHACGHDAHTAILLGACKLLYDIRDELRINVKFFFQGAEEQFGGAQYLIKDECLENPKVDYMFGLHVQSYLEKGFIECKSKTLNASSNSIKILIKGKRAHGAYPDNGIDAIVCAAQVITSLQSIISRNLSPSNMAVITLGKINGGQAQNIICEDVEILGTIRSLNKNDRDFIVNRVRNIVENTAKAFGCIGQLEVEEDGYPPVINDEELVEIIKYNTSILLGGNKYIEKEYPSMGSEDFSFYTENCKGVFFHLGCGKEKGLANLLHTGSLDIDENCLLIGTMMHVLNVMYLNERS